MELASLQKNCVTDIKRFDKAIGVCDGDEMLFQYTNRITDEIGNLNAVLLNPKGLTQGELPEAIAQAMYSLIMLAQKMDVDLAKVMKQHLKKNLSP